MPSTHFLNQLNLVLKYSERIVGAESFQIHCSTCDTFFECTSKFQTHDTKYTFDNEIVHCFYNHEAHSHEHTDFHNYICNYVVPTIDEFQTVVDRTYWMFLDELLYKKDTFPDTYHVVFDTISALKEKGVYQTVSNLGNGCGGITYSL
jgi:hypothetical protein